MVSDSLLSAGTPFGLLANDLQMCTGVCVDIPLVSLGYGDQGPESLSLSHGIQLYP
jgi:hypothetical protein